MQHVYDTYRSNDPSAAVEIILGGLAEGRDGPLTRHSMDITRGDKLPANVL